MNGYGRSVSRGPRGRLDSLGPGRHPLHVANGSTLKDLGLDVRAARKQRAWTQEELSGQANVAVSLVGKVERGQSVSDTTLKAIARALDLPDATIAPHLSEQPAPIPARIDPDTGTIADFRREMAYFFHRFRDTPQDYERLNDLLELYARLDLSGRSTQGGLDASAQS